MWKARKREKGWEGHTAVSGLAGCSGTSRWKVAHADERNKETRGKESTVGRKQGYWISVIGAVKPRNLYERKGQAVLIYILGIAFSRPASTESGCGLARRSSPWNFWPREPHTSATFSRIRLRPRPKVQPVEFSVTKGLGVLMLPYSHRSSNTPLPPRLDRRGISEIIDQISSFAPRILLSSPMSQWLYKFFVKGPLDPTENYILAYPTANTKKPIRL